MGDPGPVRATPLETTWNRDSCEATGRDGRTIRLSFPPLEQFVAIESLTGKSYPIPDGLRRFVEGLPVVDVGAHVGTTAAYFTLQLNPSEIHAYEPDERGLAWLVPNVQQMPCVKVFREAVGRETGERDFYTSAAACLSSLYKRPWDDTKRRVQGVNGQEALQRISGPIGVIKIDAEEAEVEVLTAMEPELPRARLVYLETHGEDLRRDADRILERAGFFLFHGDFEWTRGTAGYVHKDYALSIYHPDDFGAVQIEQPNDSRSGVRQTG